MPKMKTKKAAQKRLMITGARKGKKKVLHRYAAQDHFNAREPGKVARNKRRDNKAHKTNLKNIQTLLPNNDIS